MTSGEHGEPAAGDGPGKPTAPARGPGTARGGTPEPAPDTARRQAAAEAFWHARPRRCLDWRDAGEGRCVVLRPKLGESRAGRWLASRLGDPYYRIRLDDVGAFIWKACDGETPLAAIRDRMREAFGARVEPADERLGRFVQSLVRSRMIEL